MRFRSVAAGLLALLSSHALAFDATKANRYPSPDLYRPNVDRLITHGPLTCAPGAICDSSSLFAGPNGSTNPRAFSDLFSDSVNPISFGADPTGARDSTAAFKLALLTGAHIVVQPGNYLSGELRITSKEHITLLPGATIVGQALCAVNATGNTPACENSVDFTKSWAVINFAPGSEGSILDGGGTVNGNRDALVAGYLNLPMATQAGTYVSKYAWNCVQNSAADVRIENLTLTNCMISAIQNTTSGASKTADITVTNSSKMITLQGGNGATVSNVRGKNITNLANNTVIPFWQYASEFRYLNNFRISGYSVSGYRPFFYTDNTRAQRIGDPQGAAITFDHMSHGSLHDVMAEDYIWDPTDLRQTNVSYVGVLDSMNDVDVQRVFGKGYYFGLAVSGPNRVTVGNSTLDCNWNTVSNVTGVAGSAGLRLKGNGALAANGNLSSQYDHFTQMPAFDIKIDGMLATRCGVGTQLMSGNAIISNSRFDANLIAGIVPWATESNGQYPSAAPFRLSNITFNAVSASYNGGPGVSINDGYGFRLNGLVANNNGQDNNGFDPVGVSFTGNGTPKRDISLSGWSASDTQGDALGTSASFVPGSTTVVNGRNTYSVVLSRSDRVHIGQRITLTNAAGPGSSVTAKILDLANDVATLDTGAATTFATGGNLVALSGTVSMDAGGYILTGVGTNFRTSITGPAYLLIGGSYYKVGAVIDDTHLQMDTPATGAISALSAQLVQVAAAGIQSQHNGMYIPASAGAQNISWGAPGTYSVIGNTIEDITVDDSGVAAPGQATNNHIVSRGGKPTVSACGAGAAVRGTDSAMEIGTGSDANTSSCTITFAKPFRTQPICTATRSGNLATVYPSVYGASTTGFSLSFSTAMPSSYVNVVCME